MDPLLGLHYGLEHQGGVTVDLVIQTKGGSRRAREKILVVTWISRSSIGSPEIPVLHSFDLQKQLSKFSGIHEKG